MPTNNKGAYTVTIGLLESKAETVDALLKESVLQSLGMFMI